MTATTIDPPETEPTERPAAEIPKLALRIPEAALALNISQETVRRLLRRGKLKAVPSLRHKIIPIGEIQRFLRV